MAAYRAAVPLADANQLHALPRLQGAAVHESLMEVALYQVLKTFITRLGKNTRILM